MPRQWPVTLEGLHYGTHVRLRPMHARRDRSAFALLRRDNAEWTRAWDSTSPHPQAGQLSFGRVVRAQEREARDGRLLPFALEVDGELAGQVHLFNIVRGALQSGAAGYWIAERHAGRGIVPYALALMIDHALGPLRLHRVEVNIRPENTKSLRVVAKLGLRDEGVRRGYLHIAGEWHDHRSFAVTTEDLAGQSAVQRLHHDSH
ncbi:GNAT family N-acetyltransferase [Luteipulveratus halotolerans]|uniref:Alanine acetyltransferase n=1 Tax=Luteipulveratus halotolerans TaxID=1631356 RepID=A0A0L6CJZ5_9MICO|nr:GNAT family protein [Luteipulveratus halotolerans]KNX38044.1 alanine acetyltransferase [Luteipulveratus halotolerans]